MILIDSHVHFYKCFNIDILLYAAFKNFQKQALIKGCPDSFQGVLFLLDTPESIKFNELFLFVDKQSKGKKIKDWQFFNTSEKNSLIARSSGGKKLFIIAAQQITTKERIELLAIGTESHFPNGLAMEQLITDILKNDAIPIIPWGFGKWLGKRKKYINRINEGRTPIFFGDISGRPVTKCLPLNDFFNKLSRKPFLNGSDPLPFPGQEKKVGRFGFSISNSLDISKPWGKLKKILNSHEKIENYGKRDNVFQIFVNQLLLRM